MFTNERVLGFIILALIFGASIYFAVTKFNKEVSLNPSPSPTPGNLTFLFTQTSPSAQPLNSTQDQPVSKPQPVSNTQTGPSIPQPAELPLLRNKRLDKFPGVLSEEVLKGKMATIITNKGNIVIEIYPDAPKASSNFLLLASNGFYDNLTFHRVEPGFVIQGGDPLGDGRGGPGYTFEDEPVTREYVKGTVAMANAGPNTNGSQFFIMLSDHPEMPKNYTIFGGVVFGIDVVEKIVPGDIIHKAVIQSAQ